MNNSVLSSTKKMIRYFLKPYAKVIALLMLIVPISVILGELIPWYVARIINLINSNENRELIFNSLLSDFSFLLFFIFASSFLDVMFMLILQYKCLGSSGIDIRKKLFSFMLTKDWKFWNKNTGGEVWNKIDMSRRIIAAYSSIGELLNSVYRSFCTICVTLFLLYKIYPLLALVFAIMSSITLFIFNHLSKNVKKSSAALSNSIAKLSGVCVNLISNFFILKTFGTEKREHSWLSKKFHNVAEIMKETFWIKKKNLLALKMLSLTFECAMLLFAVYLWVKHKIATGDIVFIMSATVAFADKLDSFAWFIPFMKSREATLDKNIRTFNIKNNIEDNANAKALKVTEGKIEIRNLVFGYSSTKKVLKHINLVVNPKEKVGIVGLSGGGKTTLLHLIQRLINTPKKSIFIDGQDICDVTQESLHQAIGFIPQDTSLFHRTIMENLKYGRFNATNVDAINAAQQAFADIFINTFPKKYNTLTGDKGVKLSGGERQRIGIARAILRNAPILLLDEATSALDSESETYIEKSLHNVLKNKTVIVVAHRLSTLKNMDRIIVIDDGIIIEDGTPTELLRKKSTFARLWKLQQHKTSDL